MNVEEAYKHWAAQYDTDLNMTRDLEAVALRETLQGIAFGHCLEIGCGTGKNTEWLLTQGKKITAVDLSADMLAVAKRKITGEQVQFLQADITLPWAFKGDHFDLMVCSLVLEHIADLAPMFQMMAEHLLPDGILYIGELHPFKQYLGSKARFGSGTDQQEIPAFTHHVSEFTHLARLHGLCVMEVKEYFDDGNRSSIPRILSLTFKK